MSAPEDRTHTYTIEATLVESVTDADLAARDLDREMGKWTALDLGLAIEDGLVEVARIG